MELKLIITIKNHILIILLIVPYGIETLDYLHLKDFFELLIVPYGIETHIWDISN